MIINPADRLGNVKEYYFSRKLKEIRSLNAEGKDILNLGIGSPDLPPSEETILALTETASKENSHGYQQYVGIPEFRESLSKWCKSTYGVDLNPENEILPLIGSKEGIMHISMAFVNKGDKVLLPNPGYPSYASVSDLVQAEKIEYFLSGENQWNIDLDHLRSLNLDEIKLMWVNFPNMPTGSSPSIGILKELIELAKKHKFLIINDNPYSLILHSKPFSIFQIEGAKEVCLELNSLSKSHNMAGWRIGWLSGEQEYVKEVLKVKSNMDSGMFLGLQKAAIKALTNSQEWHDEQNKIYQERRTLVLKIYDLLNVTADLNQGGMFVWGKVPSSVQSTEKLIDEILYKANVFITPGFIFGSKGEGFIRASLCSSKENLQIALDRIKSAIDRKEIIL